MSDSGLHGKTAIVTGGARGIGVAVSRMFAARGANVVITGLAGDPVPEVVESIRSSGREVLPWIGDVAIEAQAELCVTETLDRFGRLDALVNLQMSPLQVVSTENCRTSDFDRAIYSDIRSVFLMTRFALPHLRETKGVILSSGSESSGIGLSLNPSHAAARAWVCAFMKGVAQETAPWGVRANTISMGPIDLPRGQGPLDLEPSVERQIRAQIPLARMARPDEIASVYAFLASDEASYVTGGTFCVDGGWSSGQYLHVNASDTSERVYTQADEISARFI